MALSKQSPTEPIDGRTPACLAALAKGQRSILAALVGVMDHGGGPALAKGHVERFEDQFGAQMSGHGPAHDAAAESVEHHRQVEKARPGRNVSDIGNPHGVGCWADEIAVDQIRRRARVMITHGGKHPGAPARAAQAGGLHQARDPLASGMDIRRAQFLASLVNPRRAIGSTRVLMDRADARGEFHIRPGPC